MTKRTMSRRGFLGLASASALGAAGLATMAGCAASGNGSDNGDNLASTKGGKADPIEPVAAPETWDEEADVVVVGTGGGLVAAVYAAQNGKKVTVLEKADSWGGTSKETDTFSVMGTKTQQQIYAALAEQMGASDDEATKAAAAQIAQLAQLEPEMMRQQWLAKYITKPNVGVDDGPYPDGGTGPCSGGVNMPVLQSLINGIAEAVDYMGAQGVPWGPVTAMGSAGMMACVCPQGTEGGRFVARANMSVFEILYNVALEAGVTFHFVTPATALIVEDGRVIGVQCEGEISNVRANDGVLLATGGMTNNLDMLEKYVPHAAQALTSCASGDEGDGIRMGLGAGAAIAGLDCSFCFDGGVECGSWGRYLYKGDVQLARQPWCLVNILGDRVPYYPVDTLGFIKQASIHMSQPGHKSYAIFDADYEENISKFDQMICRYPITPEMAEQGADFDRLPESLCEHDWRLGAKEALEGGWLVQADTLEELGQKLGFADGVLPAAVEHNNAICEAGTDEEYHYDPAWLVPVKKAPFYGIAVGATMLSTLTGLQVNPQMQVTTENGSVIEGLYASGTTAGGFDGSCNYGDCRNPGGGVAMSCGTAYIAAKTICG